MQHFADIAFNNAKENLALAISKSYAKITAKILPSLKINEMQITQLFHNLIGNAIKYRHPERPSTININWEKKDNEFFFSVSDNGIGIAPENYERIFQPFERLHTWKEYEGICPGLSFCKKIVEKYRGRYVG